MTLHVGRPTPGEILLSGSPDDYDTIDAIAEILREAKPAIDADAMPTDAIANTAAELRPPIWDTHQARAAAEQLAADRLAARQS